MEKLGNFEDKIKARKVVKARMKYGVHITDTWSLNHYLSRVIGNGLVLLADNLHGAPAGYPKGFENHDNTDFEAWKNDVRKYGKIFIKYSRKDDIEWEMHDFLQWPKERENHWEPAEYLGPGYQIYKSPDESTDYGKVWKQWVDMTAEFNKEIDEEIKEALAWFSTWFESLWD